VILAIVFVIIAFIYASVGFGGGSSYTALLIASGMEYTLVPVIALVCNLVVVAGGVFHYWRSGAIDWKFSSPLLAGSVPAAFVGGLLPVGQEPFILILSVSLAVAGVLLVLDRQWAGNAGSAQSPRTGMKLALGAGLGGLAGITGIGGGIYLAPVLHLFRMASARTVAATASLFILVNSAAGLGGQLTKLVNLELPEIDPDLWILPIAVLVGGQLGSRLGAHRLPASPIRRLTGLLILAAVVRLWLLP
jgi:uncharacterized membrane protein YfcA